MSRIWFYILPFSCEISQAFPRPAIPVTFSVPALKLLSCGPPVIIPLSPDDFLTKANPEPFGP
jgi:hypothetical protein